MNLRDLAYLLTLEKLRHFGDAAEACHVSQPTLSMQIKKLEDFLGVTLVERQRGDVRLTPAGEDVAVRARAILQLVEELKSSAKAHQDPFSGRMYLGVFPTLAPYFLPRMIPSISQSFPKLRLLLTEEKTGHLLEQLESGRIDAALLALPVDHSALESAFILEDEFMLAVPAGHALSGRKKVSASDLAGHELLLLEDGHCMRAQALEICQLAGAGEWGDFRATSLETLRQMVATGAGITLMPRIAIRMENTMVRYIPFKAPVPARRIGLVWRSSSPRKLLMKALAEHMRQLCANGIYSNT